MLSSLSDGVGQVLLQYGALGAIALCSIYGVAWLIKGMRNDVHSMIQANEKGNQAFTSYLIKQSELQAENAKQANATNAAFVEAINNLTRRIDKYVDPRGVGRAPETGAYDGD